MINQTFSAKPWELLKQYMGCNNFHVDCVHLPSYSFQRVVGSQHGSAIEIPFNDMTAWLE